MASSSSFLPRRTRLLKDFLNEDHHFHQPCARKLTCKRLAAAAGGRSNAASTTISVIHKVMINMVRIFPSVKSPSSILPRIRISKKLTSSSKKMAASSSVDHTETPTTVFKVKDILSWRSSATTAALDGRYSYYSPPNSSRRSSLCDSDFTAEDLSSCCGEISGDGGHFMAQVDLELEEKEQHSPVSVLVSPFREDQNFTSLATIQSANNDESKHIITKTELKAATTEDSTSCCSGSGESYDWEVEEKREAYITDMQNEAAAGKSKWRNFEEEREEMCMELELQVFTDLVTDVLMELFCTN